MSIEALGGNLTVSSIPELEWSLKWDSDFWNLVSIHESALPRPTML